MHLPAPLVKTAVLAIVVLITSCSSNQKPVADTNVAEFIGVPLNEMNWTPIPDGEGILIVTLVGDPSELGPLVTRYKIPPNMEIDPHTHRKVRSYTVLSGVWELGFGETFDPRDLQSFPQGSYYRLPSGVPHYQKAGPEGAVIQIESIGPDTFDLVEQTHQEKNGPS